MCRYECGTELGDFDEKQNKYLELSGTLHTRERCESLKNRTSTKAAPVKGEDSSPFLGQVPQSEIIRRLKEATQLIYNCTIWLEQVK